MEHRLQSATAKFYSFGVLILFVFGICAVLFSISSPVSAATITETKPGEPVSLSIPSTDLEISGCVAPNALVAVLNNGSSTGAVSSDADGRFTQTLTAQTPTIHTINSSFEDTDGRSSSVTSDLIALQANQLTRLVVNPAPTVAHSPNVVVAGGLITFRGYACPGATVTVTVDGNTTLSAVATEQGEWSITLNSLNFTAGSHSYTVIATSTDYLSERSDVYQFTVGPSGEGQPETSDDTEQQEVDLSTPVVITSPDDGFRSGIRDVAIAGTGPPNTQIEVFVDGVLVGSVFSNAFGEWSLTVAVLGLQQQLSARACNQFGCGDVSNTISVLYGLSGEDSLASGRGCDLKIYLEEYRFSEVPVGGGVDLDLRIEGSQPRFDALVDWGDVVVSRSVLDEREQRLHHTYATSGQFNGSVAIQTDDGACKDVVYFSVRVIDRVSQNYFFLYAAGFLTPLLAYGLLRLRIRMNRHKKDIATQNKVL